MTPAPGVGAVTQRGRGAGDGSAAGPGGMPCVAPRVRDAAGGAVRRRRPLWWGGAGGRSAGGGSAACGRGAREGRRGGRRRFATTVRPVLPMECRVSAGCRPAHPAREPLVALHRADGSCHADATRQRRHRPAGVGRGTPSNRHQRKGSVCRDGRTLPLVNRGEARVLKHAPEKKAHGRPAIVACSASCSPPTASTKVLLRRSFQGVFELEEGEEAAATRKDGSASRYSTCGPR